MPTEGNINRISSPGLDRERAAMKKLPEPTGSSTAANRIHHVDDVSNVRQDAVEISQKSEGVIQSSPEQKSELLDMTDAMTTLVMTTLLPQTANAARAEFIGRAEGFEDDEPVSVAAVTKLLTEHFANQAGNRETELDAFKKQVIRAFKHLGLDTMKHFGV